jgi:hypothetical protein
MSLHRLQGDLYLLSFLWILTACFFLLANVLPVEGKGPSPLDIMASNTAIKNSTSKERPREFIHDPLLSNSSSIRLLRLLAGTEDETLCGEIEHFEISRAPEYRAVSYVWGPPVFSCDLIISGKILRLTKSISYALHKLRDPQQAVWLWADSICINQKNIEERGHQVKLMKDVYRNASDVAFCLGMDIHGDAKKAVEVLTKTERAPETARLRETLGQDNWNKLYALFSHEWFRRVWVFQEAVLAPSGFLLWGNERISWNLLQENYVKLQNNISRITPPECSQAIMLLYEMFQARKARLAAEPWYSVVVLADVMRSASCTDPRDRVYGMLGLDVTSEENLSSIEPDYTKSVESVYLDFARAVLAETKSLYLLSRIQHCPNLERWFPGSQSSWVPNWNQPREIGITGFHLFSSSCGLESTSTPADRIRTSEEDREKLFLDGFIYTKITRRSRDGFGLGIEWVQQSPSLVPILDAWEKVVKPLMEVSYAHEPILQFHDVLLEGRPNAAVSASTESAFEHFVAYCQEHAGDPTVTLSSSETSFKDFLKATKAVSKGIKREPEPVSLTQEWATMQPDVEFLKLKYATTSHFNSIFSTEAGLLGQGPAATCDGDLICIVAGANMPFILRRQDGFYRVVGSAYVYGIMQGEAVNYWTQWGREVETLEIR